MVPVKGTPMSRRAVLTGLAASLSACATAAPTEQFLAQPSAPDSLSRYRLPSTASAAQWGRHLDLAVLHDDPQLLALSGGAEDGAFGAGALCGWSQHGTRPQFDIVTGVSTGALIAPFAFLGAEYDDILSRMFNMLNASDIMRLNVATLFNDGALYDTTPLADMIAAYTPPALIKQVAARHANGARLFVVTSNLETSQAIIWNMGEIAQARWDDLFRAVIRASSALPGMFPAVTLKVGRGSTAHEETHVDGGVQMQFLAAPDAAFDVPRRKHAGGHAYLLINNTLQPAPQTVSHSALGITQQALTAMVRANAASSVNAARLLAKRQRLGFSLASVAPDPDAVYDPDNRFSTRYMQALFKQGRKRALEDRLWES
ncbi:patatin-like phospholipase family protein [Thioclava sp.]|uniref:patatin-like phospholipase family protein n=1 Tax=Thioclava sp. TaxID=1933450 RepID=UPI003AA9B525